MKKLHLVKRIVSFMLVIAMVITFLPSVITNSVSAAETQSMTIHCKIPGDRGWSTPAVQFWGGDAVVSDSTSSGVITAWDDRPTAYFMTEEEDGWYKLTLTGSVGGFQFLDFANPGKNSGNAYVSAMQCCEAGQNVYVVGPNWTTWFLDKECQTSIDTLDTREIGDCTVTMHFNRPSDWGDVYTKIAEDSGWNAISGYAYANGWPGAEVEADSSNAGWYSFTISTTNEKEFHCIINNNNNGKQTANINLNLELGSNEYWIDGANVSSDKPESWVDSTSNAPVNPSAVVSPVVEGNKITFNLDATGQYKDAEKIELMGTVPGASWTPGSSIEMKRSEDGSVYTATVKDVAPGLYLYKYFTGTNNWFIDPMNEKTSGGNSAVVVAGLTNTSIDAQRNIDTVLPNTLDFYKADGTKLNVDVSYELKNESDASNVTLTVGSEGKAVKVAGDSSLTEVKLVAKYNDGSKEYKSEVTVSVKDKVYQYNVYYYDATEAHMSTSAADIWAWEVGGGNLGPISFTEVTELSDGKNWLKATIKTSATNIGLIPRSAGAWNWQTGDHNYNNTQKNEVTDLYIVYGDDANTYTAIPEIKELRERYVVVEYNRTDNDYTGWNIYSWNSGFGSSTEIYSNELNGKHLMVVPVKDSAADFDLSFCMRKTTGEDAWSEKDGGDHNIHVPANQNVVYAVFNQGQGVTSVLDYNKGYQMLGAQDKINFYYRDDTLLLTNEEGSLNKVQVVVNGRKYDMTYNASAMRYEYEMNNCVEGDYAYYYLIDDVKVLDAFNENTTTYADEECSVFTYKDYSNLAIEGKLQLTSMNYRQNNVLSVKLVGEDANNITTDEIETITVDLAGLGLGKQSVETELLETTIACKDTVKPGTYSLPIVMNDIYGNVYTTSVRVVVVECDTEGFDWDEAVIYFAVTDRFFDGNTSNNTGIQGENDVNKDGSLSYHGGDFKGLEDKLDYLEELGVNTIWITPIVAQSDITAEDNDKNTIESTGYHGYWASSFEKLNGHLGTEEEFSALISAAHARGMKLMVDVVLNHSGYDSDTVDVTGYFNTLIQNENGEYVAMVRDSSNTVANDDVYGSLAGLPDFVTENPAVRDQLIDWQTNWVEKYGIDYFRVDTVKHVNTETWEAFKNELTKIDPEFKMIGEYSGGGSTTLDSYQGAMDSLLDFDFNDFAQNFVTGNISSVEESLQARNSRINNTSTTGAFLSSHDEDGLVYKLIDQNDFTEEEALNLFKVASVLQMTAKGQVVVYYGEEIGLYGADNYPVQSNRYDFDWSEVETQKLDSNSMYNHYRTLLGIRNTYSKLLAKGTRSSIAVSDEDGYDVFVRSYKGENVYVGLNITEETNKVTFKVNEAAGTVLVDLYNNKEYTVSDKQTITVDIPAAKNGGAVIIAEKKLPIVDDDTEKDIDDTIDENSKDKADDESMITEAVEKVLASFEATVEIVVENIRTLVNGDMAISGDDSILPAGAKFEASILAETSPSYVKAKTLLAEKKLDGKFSVYEINLKDSSNVQIHKLNGFVAVTIAIPDGFTVTRTKTIGVYRLEDDGTLTKCVSEVVDGKLTFTTDHFSTYIFVEEPVVEENAKDTVNTSSQSAASANTTPVALASVKTGDDTHALFDIMFVVMGFVILAGVAVLDNKKRKVN